MKLFPLVILLFININNVKAQVPIRRNELNNYYLDNLFFNKELSEINDLVLQNEVGNTKLYTYTNDNEYLGTLKLSTKPKYYFYKNHLKNIDYHTNEDHLIANVNSITKLYSNPNGYTELFKDSLALASVKLFQRHL
jgi:hypothetical protein